MKEYTIGSYVSNGWQITEEIGSGANGTVYKIEKSVGSVKTVSALKVIRIPQSQSAIKAAYSEGMDEVSITAYFQGFVDEILKEVALMDKLKNHPNIVGYQDSEIIKHKDGIGWDILIRMELLTPLDTYLLKHPMDEREAIQMGLDLTSALSYCHKEGVIHRDIKPANIFVTETGIFKLGDFGIARTIEKTTGGLSKKGTESYMAPEVYLVRPYGKSVDQYSLGMVLYSCMNNNRLPFLPPYPEAIKFSQREEATARRMRGDELPKPVNASEGFSNVILRACNYDPKNRYSSVDEFHEALNVLVPKEVEKTPPPFTKKKKFDFKQIPKKAWYAGVGIICIVALIMTLGNDSLVNDDESTNTETTVEEQSATEETLKTDEEYEKEFEKIIVPFLEKMCYVNGDNWETASMEEIGKSLEGDFTFQDENYDDSDTYTYDSYSGTNSDFHTFTATDINYDSSIRCDEIDKDTWKLREADETAQLGDKVEIDYLAKENGKALEGEKGSEIIIGSGSYPDEFENQLVGVKTGDTKEITATYPDDYNYDVYAGKTITFEVTVVNIYASVPRDGNYEMYSVDWEILDEESKTLMVNEYFPDAGFKLRDSQDDVLAAIGITPDMLNWLKEKGEDGHSWFNEDFWSVTYDDDYVGGDTKLSLYYVPDYEDNDDAKSIYLIFRKEDNALQRVSFDFR